MVIESITKEIEVCRLYYRAGRGKERVKREKIVLYNTSYFYEHTLYKLYKLYKRTKCEPSQFW